MHPPTTVKFAFIQPLSHVFFLSLSACRPVFEPCPMGLQEVLHVVSDRVVMAISIQPLCIACTVEESCVEILRSGVI